MKYNMPERVLRDVRRFAENNAVEKVILFGSRARGVHMARSDIDIAVSGGDFDGFYDDVQEKTHSLLMFDIVNLDDGISDGLQQEIARDGVMIYEKA